VDDTVTKAGWIWGTPAYMAPEQIEPGRRLTARTDVYQLAATLYALLAAEPPFTGEPAQLVYAVVHQAPADLVSIRGDISPAFAAIVAQAMAKDPMLRPASPGEFARHLVENAATQVQPIPPRLATAPSPWAAGAGRIVVTDEILTAPVQRATTERFDRLRPTAAYASSASTRRSSTRRTAVLGGALAAVILAGAAGIAWVGYGQGRPSQSGGADEPVAGVVEQQTPSPTATPNSTPSPTPQRTATPTPSPTPSPTRRPASVATDGVPGQMQFTMLRRGYLPSGPVVPVPLARNAVMYVQRGDGADGQRLFIFVNDRFIGTDWEDASPDGVSNARAVGTGQFAATYSQDNGPPVTITFTLTEDGLQPNAVAPGHCEPGRRC
jgi:serine/threonine protein kinase